MSDLNHHEFQIFTTLRYDRSCYSIESSPDSNNRFDFLYLPFYHQRRLLEACKYFGWSSALAKVQDSGEFLSDIERFICTNIAEDYDISSPMRVKVIVSKDGSIIFEGEPTATVHVRNLYPPSLGDLLSTALSADSDTHMYVLHVSRQKIHPFPHTRIKTTYRRHYRLAQKEVGILHELDRNEVLLTNSSGEVMEGSYSSVYFFRHGQWVTPHVESGGQDGTTRKWALERRLCVESKILFESLVDGEHCCISNGVRGFHIALATTPVDPRVLDSMLPFYCGLYGNPHSRTHAYGWETETAVEEARKYIADLIGADPKEIIFTSGATESNNMSIKGLARFCRRSGKKRHIITTQTEHKCVLDSCRHLQDEDFSITYLPVQSNGLINLKNLEDAIRPETALISIMSVNNEIGVIQPIEEIGRICRARKVFFHTDAAQAVGKIPLDVNKMNIDLMSISSHKIYGPKGIGACYVRRRPRVRLEPLISGGGQERGLRSGTLAPALVVGFGEACRIAIEEMAYDSIRIKTLSDRLLSGLLSMEHTMQNGDPESFYPGCVNVSFSYVEGESLLMALKDIALSSGSACTSASLEPSYVLRALGSSDESAHSSIRFGIGRFTTEGEIDYVLKAIRERVSFLRELSPLWELVQEGIALDSIQWSQH